MQDTSSPSLKILEPVIFKQYKRIGASNKVQLGDKLLDVSDDFRLYITTKLNNPDFGSEISSKTLLLNFVITQEGLED